MITRRIQRTRTSPAEEECKVGIALKGQLIQHANLGVDSLPLKASWSSEVSVTRGDWFIRFGSRDVEVAPHAKRTILADLTGLGLISASRLDRITVPFINTHLDTEVGKAFRGPEAGMNQMITRIEKRTAALESRIISDVPIAGGLFDHYWGRDGTPVSDNPSTLGAENSKIYLDKTLQGAWRWAISRRPIWLLQLWESPNNFGGGDGKDISFLGEDQQRQVIQQFS